MGGNEVTLKFEYYNISMKTKPNLTRSGGTFGMLKILTNLL